MRVFIFVIVIAMAVIGLGSIAQAEECTFEETTTNFYDTAGNWSCSGVPGSDDTVVLDDSDDVCVVRAAGSDQACISFSLVPGTILTIETGRTLTITGNCVVDGTVNMQGTLSLSSSLTISGDGTIILQQKTGTGAYTSRITGSTLTLSDDTGGSVLTAVGTGEIENVLVNNARILAGHETSYCDGSPACDFDGVFELEAAVSGSGKFEAADGEELELQSTVVGSADWEIGDHSANQITLLGIACLNGDFLILNGRLEIQEDFCTCGDLDLGDTGSSDSAEVAVLAGMTATFGACPGCACGG